MLRGVGIGEEPGMVPELGLKQWPLSQPPRPRAMRGQWLKTRRGTCLQRSSDHWLRDTTSPSAPHKVEAQETYCLASLLSPGAEPTQKPEHRTAHKWAILVGPQGGEWGGEGGGWTWRSREMTSAPGSMAEGTMRVAKTQALPLPGCVALSKSPNPAESYFPL